MQRPLNLVREAPAQRLHLAEQHAALAIARALAPGVIFAAPAAPAVSRIILAIAVRRAAHQAWSGTVGAHARSTDAELMICQSRSILVLCSIKPHDPATTLHINASPRCFFDILLMKTTQHRGHQTPPIRSHLIGNLIRANV
jgi:hypothetical protein